MGMTDTNKNTMKIVKMLKIALKQERQREMLCFSRLRIVRKGRITPIEPVDLVRVAPVRNIELISG